MCEREGERVCMCGYGSGKESGSKESEQKRQEDDSNQPSDLKRSREGDSYGSHGVLFRLSFCGVPGNMGFDQVGVDC